MVRASRIDLWGYLRGRDQTVTVAMLIGECARTCLGLTRQWLGIGGGTFAPHPRGADGKWPGPSHGVARRIEKLEAEVAYRQLLLEEVIHRTKNTLQLAVIILDEQIDAAGDAWISDNLKSLQKQLRTLSRTHNRYYGPIHSESRSLNLHLSEICSSVFNSFGERSGRIALSISVAEIQLRRHQEISLSLILDELLTNVLKHAFPCDRRGTVAVSFDVDDHSICHLAVRDNGVGRHLTYRGSTGLALVQGFALGLRGCLEITSHRGTTARVSFPLAAR
jgi:two-component sensor histidine kinase